MSDDELEKLASALKNIKSSKEARKDGMAAAMAAFDAEFAAETVSQKETTSEKISTTTQGLADAPRPTDQTARDWRVQTLGRNAMTMLSNIFNMKPRTAMMGGTCMAAFIASFVVYQGMPMDRFSTPAPVVVEAVAEGDDKLTGVAPELEEVVVTGSRVARDGDIEQEAPSEVQIVQLPPSPAVEALPNFAPQSPVADKSAEAKSVPAPQGGINSINNLLNKVRTNSARTESENRDREAKFRQSKDEQAKLMATRPTIRIGDKAQGELSQSDIGRLAAPSDASVPMVEKQVQRRVVKAPASTVERSIPAITKTETRRVRKEDGTFYTVTEAVVVQEATTEYISIPPTYETITETVLVPSRDQFEGYELNPVTSVEDTPVSTFSIDVDTASYSFLRASLNRGELPPPGAIRLEEMINYFPYDYEAPMSADEPFKANVTVTPTPWNVDTKLMHIGIKGYVPQMDEKPRSNIVFLIDTSGSMNQANKLPLLINSFKLLLSTLDEGDTVSIVTYAGRAGTVLEPTPAGDKNKIKEALSRLRAGGSTAGAAGLELAYQKARESFDEDGVNRVILATDGDFNVGFSSHEEMKTFIEKKRETGIYLSVLGFGQGNYNDQLMQSLAQNGNGVAAYIDTLSEANKVLANEAGSALITIAKDVKIQVEFNPETISEYRLIGYETRALKREDFNNDKVDAGEINSGHTVTAIYELTPVDSPAKVFDPLRYVTDKLEKKSTGSDELAFVKIRHKLPNSDTSTLQTFPIGPSQEQSLNRASDDMRFAAAVAAVGQKLRGDTQLADYSYEDAIALASGAKGEDKNGYRSEFIQLVRLAENLQD